MLNDIIDGFLALDTETKGKLDRSINSFLFPLKCYMVINIFLLFVIISITLYTYFKVSN